MGIPTLKLTGHYLAMTTIGFGVILQLILINAIWLTNGSDGITKIPSPRIGSIELKDPSSFFYLAAVTLILLTWASIRLKDSRIGRAFLAIQGNEMAAETVGIDTTYYKIMAFALSAGLRRLRRRPLRPQRLPLHQPRYLFLRPVGTSCWPWPSWVETAPPSGPSSGPCS